jgi:hypothetical protein
MSGGARTVRGGGMNTAGRLTVLALVAAVTLSGCRAVAPGSPAVTSADPLGSVETRVDQIERQIDHDGTR